MIGSLVVLLVWLFVAFLKPEEKKPVVVIVILFLFSIVFWACYEQAGSSFTLFADRFTNRYIFGREFPASWYQSSPALFVVLLTPIFVLLWRKMGERQPSSPVKFSVGLLFVGLGATLLLVASLFTAGGAKVGPWWVVGVYALQTPGGIFLYPRRLRTTTQIAPHARAPP